MHEHLKVGTWVSSFCIEVSIIVFSWVKPSLGFLEDSSGFRWADLDFLMPFSFNNIVLKALKV